MPMLPDFKNIKLSQKALILVSVPLCFEMFFAFVLFQMVQKSEAETRRAEKSRLVFVYADAMVRRLYELGMATIAQKSIGATIFESSCKRVAARLDDDLSKLEETVSDDPQQKRSVLAIKSAVKQVLSVLERGMAAVNPAEQDFPLHYEDFDYRGELEPLLQSLARDVQVLTDREKTIRKTRPDAEEHAKLLVRIALLSGLVANVILAVWLALYFNSSTIKRLNVVMDNTVRLSEGKALVENLAGSDEIAVLDRTFHDMASRLEEAAEKERVIKKLKQEFFQMVSHDLRTPLTTIQFFISAIAQGSYGQVSEKGRRAADGSLSAVDRLLSMVNELLEMERLASDGFKLEMSACNLDDLLDKALELVLGFAEKNNVELQLELMSAEGLEFQADESRVVQVLVNLVSNAVKFSPAGSKVKIKACKVDDAVEFSVIDSGRGIAEEQLGIIFERFGQLMKEDAIVKGGSGLGLTICKTIVEAHGGSIGVESKLNEGSRFWFKIPLASS